MSLLHGTVGSGKTTLARIYGQALVCEGQLGEDGVPVRVMRRVREGAGRSR
jgi:DNA polymerase III gamma/tau subunit